MKILFLTLAKVEVHDIGTECYQERKKPHHSIEDNVQT